MESEKVASRVGNAEDDLQEEEKIEMFFSLIRSFHEARNRRRENLNGLEEKGNKKKKIRRTDNRQEEQSSWIPSFEWQDFTEDIEFRRSPIIFPSPCNKKEEKKQVEEDGLDLKLAL
ncbi:protein NIM1-INTERACTING 1-like [Mangifera indica]|uniref:protein NIM1-INTERACTING 1-like n=1 Tax=Mangifera indica TaxID=29780 RepID=UPI001CFC08F8|nr:protein NIM1-INTERACTING 1-like [Mangifera indica]